MIKAVVDVLIIAYLSELESMLALAGGYFRKLGMGDFLCVTASLFNKT